MTFLPITKEVSKPTPYNPVIVDKAATACWKLESCDQLAINSEYGRIARTSPLAWVASSDIEKLDTLDKAAADLINNADTFFVSSYICPQNRPQIGALMSPLAVVSPAS